MDLSRISPISAYFEDLHSIDLELLLPGRGDSTISQIGGEITTNGYVGRSLALPDTSVNSSSTAIVTESTAPSGQLTAQPTKESLIEVSSLRRWLVELLSALVAIIALIAIVVTIGTHDGRPLPDWPYKLNVNSLVSVFAVILKVTLIIPVAEG
jgi:hypothetical protein